MARRILLTGFPGFLGSELARRIVRRPGRAEVICVVQRKFAELAIRRADEICEQEAIDRARILLVEGDITREGLAIEDAGGFAARVAEVFHLAAAYDLSVKREVGMKVNVEGTRNVLDFAARCPKLERFQYVSTCYVSGRWAGIFRETDLEKGQDFNNFYEETKYLAEIEVRRRREEGLPTTIYRRRCFPPISVSITISRVRIAPVQRYRFTNFSVNRSLSPIASYFGRSLSFIR